jgi:hypothetical protein
VRVVGGYCSECGNRIVGLNGDDFPIIQPARKVRNYSNGHWTNGVEVCWGTLLFELEPVDAED